MPSLLILLPLFGLIILNLPFRRTMTRMAYLFAALLFIGQIMLAIWHHPIFWNQQIEIVDSFFRMPFAVDHLSFLVLFSMGLVSLASLLVSRSVVYDDSERFNFVNLLILSSIGMSGVVMVKDIFSLYVFLEITAVSAFVMIALRKDRLALEGALKYIVLSTIATIMMLSAIALLLLVSGDTSFSGIRSALVEARTSRMVTLALGIFISGLFIKGGLVPFHGWLPDAYQAAPAPVSVLLAGILTKVSGIYTLIRIVTVLFGFPLVLKKSLMFAGAISIVVGALAALNQKDFKRMLAYSSISQVGYIILGLGCGSVLGVVGAAFHLFNHAIFKSLLFVNAAAVEKVSGTTDMDRLGGIAQKMPITGATSVIGILSTCGIPPLAGFWSKLIIIIAVWQTHSYKLAAIAVMASLLTLGYMLSMQRRVFFGKLKEGLEGINEIHPRLMLASIILASVTVGVGLCFPLFYNNFILPIKEILP